MTQSELLPLCVWEVPLTSGETCRVEAIAGSCTTVVGPNGTGKSALGHWMQIHNGDAKVQRLIAHRRLWLEHAGPSITSAQRQSASTNIHNWSQQPESRWLDHANAQRPDVVLFDLLARVNERNARVAAAIDGGGSSADAVAQVEDSPLMRLNVILAGAQLKLELVLTESATFDAVGLSEAARYPISQLSDGEKSALLLAAEVMAAPKDCVIVIDEPERHLHRSISAGLIEAIVADRSDCHFVILTHDLDLATTLPAASNDLLVLTECIWSGAAATAWNLRRVPRTEALPDAVRAAVLGGRRQIAFLEGEASSLDAALYRLLLPGWTLQPVGSCESVIRSVTGLRSSADLHWLEPHGIVDGDGRSTAERDTLLSKGIVALPISEIESVYYLPEVFDALAVQQAERLEQDPAAMKATVRADLLAELRKVDTAERLAADVAEKVLRRSAIAEMPDATRLRTAGTRVAISLASPYAELLEEFRQHLAAEDLAALIRDFPIRDSGARAVVATRLGFQNIGHYEAAVRNCLREDKPLAAFVRVTAGLDNFASEAP